MHGSEIIRIPMFSSRLYFKGNPMQKRSISLALTAAVLLWCLGALSARAGSVGLPTTLDHFVNPDGTSNGNYTNVERQIDPYTFSHFTYSTDPVGSPPSLANIT